MFLGYVVFMTLESKDFANTYIYSKPQETGLVTMEGFLRFWAVVFFMTTTLVALLKTERASEGAEMAVAETYRITARIFMMPSVLTAGVFLLTAKIGMHFK